MSAAPSPAASSPAAADTAAAPATDKKGAAAADYTTKCAWQGVVEMGPMPASASLLFNNLAVRGDVLAFCSGSCVNLVKRPGPANISLEEYESTVLGEHVTHLARIDLGDIARPGNMTSSVLFVPPPSLPPDSTELAGTALAVATSYSLVLIMLRPRKYSCKIEGEHIYEIEIGETPVNTLARRQARGLAAIPLAPLPGEPPRRSLVLTGTAAGVVIGCTIKFMRDYARKGFEYDDCFALQTPCCAISCVAAPVAAHANPRARWLCADDEGCICVYERYNDDTSSLRPPRGLADSWTVTGDSDTSSFSTSSFSSDEDDDAEEEFEFTEEERKRDLEAGICLTRVRRIDKTRKTKETPEEKQQRRKERRQKRQEAADMRRKKEKERLAKETDEERAKREEEEKADESMRPLWLDGDSNHKGGEPAPSTCSALGWERVALFSGSGVPCVSAAFLPDPAMGGTGLDYVVAAFASGHVRLLSLATNSALVEIAAHSRSITAMAVHPHLPFVLTVSEDSWLRVWSMWRSHSSRSSSSSSSSSTKKAIAAAAAAAAGEASDAASEGASGPASPRSALSMMSAHQRSHRFDISLRWCAFLPFTMWTGVCFAEYQNTLLGPPNSTALGKTTTRIKLPQKPAGEAEASTKKPPVNPNKCDICCVAYDLCALFTYHGLPDGMSRLRKVKALEPYKPLQ